ncbi:MAG: TlpA family protein disulfide reductase [Gammaproteobacteria bacterium]|nr:TlpA family protein disulfide reductase [Gammaproteobacteria bacterium]MBU1724168.1 TlpA family protein disulfide reductase [Gammaproteobacteria bacterium]MBU2006735.1 TlpA family protein disulfide reductase [Gammaproteobacteria bacterium]
MAAAVILMLGVMAFVWFQTPQKLVAPLDLPGLSGERIHIPDPQGRMTWVSMWSSSCAVCLKELPELDALHHEYSERLQVAAIAMPYDPPNTVVEARDRLQLGLPVVLDMDGVAVRQFAPDLVVPANHLLDPQGRIVHSVRGALSRADMLVILGKYGLPPALQQTP